MRSLLLAPLLLWSLQVFSQCDVTLKPSENATVAYKTRGNRCEGTYSAKVGAPTLDLVGLTIGAFVYKLENTETIKIENSTGSDINIRSSALPINTYYRMDAVLGNGKTLNWEIKDVLFDLKIPSNSLGIYGWTGTQNEKVYIPLKTVSSSSDLSNKKLYMVIRPNSKVLSVKYRYANIGKPLSSYQEINNSFKSGQPIVITLPEGMHGDYMIEIAAMLESGSDWVKKQYKMAVK